MVGHSGRYTDWRSYCSPACYRWATQHPSGLEYPSRGLGFHTVKCEPHFVRRRLGSYGRAWLRWFDCEGSTPAIPLAHFCPQASPYLQMVMGTALSGCESAHA